MNEQPIITGISDSTAPYGAHYALSDQPAQIADTMLALARQSARLLSENGWEGDGESYDLGAFPGDVDALTDALGRAPTLAERVSFEGAVRALLGAS